MGIVSSCVARRQRLHRGALGLQHGRLARHDDRLLERADGQSRVDAKVEALSNGDIARGVGLKSLQLDNDLVGAGQQVWHVVAAGLVGDDVARQVGLGLRHGDRRTRKRRTGFVGDVTEQRAVERLRGRL